MHLDRLAVGYVTLDRALRCTLANDAGARLIGRDAADLIGSAPWRARGPHDEPLVARACREALRQAAPVALTARAGNPVRNLAFRVFPGPDGVSVLFEEATRPPTPAGPDGT